MDDKNTRVSALETYGGYGHISVLCRILSGVGPIPYTAIGIHTFQLVWNSTLLLMSCSPFASLVVQGCAMRALFVGACSYRAQALISGNWHWCSSPLDP